MDLSMTLCDERGDKSSVSGQVSKLSRVLFQVGAHRCHDLTETTCIYPQLGSGPFNNTSGSGFYTTYDYKEILQYANDRHVEIIPEFDSPGHAQAAIRAMEARYWKLMAAGDTVRAGEFRLFDPADTSAYMSKQQYTDNVINTCLESTYNFFSHVVMEVKVMHAAIQPLRVFNFGGDEVPPGAWVNSSACWTLNGTSGPLTDAIIFKVRWHHEHTCTRSRDAPMHARTHERTHARAHALTHARTHVRTLSRTHIHTHLRNAQYKVASMF
jgi:hypothetical protein